MKKGFTLIEILISAFLFFVIILIATSAMSYTLAMKSRMDQIRKLQQDGQIALDTIESKLEQVDSTHCAMVYGSYSPPFGYIEPGGAGSQGSVLAVENSKYPNDQNEVPGYVFVIDQPSGNLVMKTVVPFPNNSWGTQIVTLIPKVKTDDQINATFSTNFGSSTASQSYYNIKLSIKTKIMGRDESIDLNTSYTMRHLSQKCSYFTVQP